MKKIAGMSLLLFLLGSISGCATVEAPVTARPGPDRQAARVVSADAKRQESKRTQHTVAKGDTLYSIAWRYGYDYRVLAAWNRIKEPFTIYPGQVIMFKPASRSRAAPAESKKQSRQPDRSSVSAPGSNAPDKIATPPRAMPLRWQWPARGKLLKTSTPTAKKGISIAGRAGQKVVAAATGTVVYSGSGLRGYGNLIIIKHSAAYLSAYAHNRDLIVKEGETVAAGQQISTMGVDSKGAPVLHFEIRKNGKPIDPLGQLPSA